MLLVSGTGTGQDTWHENGGGDDDGDVCGSGLLCLSLEPWFWFLAPCLGGGFLFIVDSEMPTGD